MSHIPKRATQHGIYMPGHEVPPTCLKPGQTADIRQLYQEEVKDNEETYLAADIEKGSVYQRQMARVRPTDYWYPTKPIKQTQPPEGAGHHGCAHWKSEYRSNVNDAARFDTILYRQNGPCYQIANPPTCVGAGEVPSQFQADFGKYGSNPRDKLPPKTFDKMPTLKTALTVGTTKGTAHIPGYQGFLATNTVNPKVAAVAHGGNLRSTDKANITQVFHTNCVGYAGHKPENARNDRGGVTQDSRTTIGRDFPPPPPEVYQQ